MKSIKLTIRILGFLSLMILLAWNISLAQKADIKDDTDFDFYAVYKNLAKNPVLWGENAAMSGDGSKLIFGGWDTGNNELLLYTIDTDGSNHTAVSVPLEMDKIDDLAMNKDGSRAFFHTGLRICKVEGDWGDMIYVWDEHPELEDFNSMKITAGGDTIYVRKNENFESSIWQMNQDGSGLVKVFEAKEVSRDGGTGSDLTEFAISDDGDLIAFILNGYRDDENVFHLKPEIFVKDGSGFRQLTDDSPDIYKYNLAISGNGSTIVFNAAGTENKWYSIQSDGSNKIELGDKYPDVAGPVLTYDGTKMFYSDDGAHGGRLVHTDGSGQLDLFAQTLPNALGVSFTLDMNEDGSMISFKYRHGGFTSWYVGHLNGSEMVSDAPSIESINFDPSVMPNNDPYATVILTSRIDDPQDLEDIEITATHVLLDGIRESPGSPDIPVRFFSAVNDNGWYPDDRADDGIFSSEGEPGPTIDQYSEVTVRVGAIDVDGHLAVADKTLEIAEAPDYVENYEKIPDRFELYQNYPNPFNPNTIINYELRITSDAELSVYNLIGQKVAMLVNERKQAGYHQVEWDASGFASGVYYYRIEAGDFVDVRKMVLLR
jgi:hypothetical protein